MNNYKYANWVITCLLPKNTNPEVAIDEQGYIQTIKDCRAFLNDYQWKYAWDWEDIRLYLLNKGYIINIEYVAYPNKGYTAEIHDIVASISFYYDTYEDWNYDDGEEYIFQTYEKARKLAIKYCLELINKDETTK